MLEGATARYRASPTNAGDICTHSDGSELDSTEQIYAIDARNPSIDRLMSGGYHDAAASSFLYLVRIADGLPDEYFRASYLRLQSCCRMMDGMGTHTSTSARGL